MADEVDAVLRAYPRIYFACHTQHVSDPDSNLVLTSRQASVLDHLDTVEGMGLGQLARHLGVSAATMCVLVDRLEDLRCLTRTRSTTDRRRVVLKLTALGARLREAQSVLSRERLSGVLSSMKPDDRARAVQGLELLAQAADAYLGKHGSGWSMSHDEEKE